MEKGMTIGQLANRVGLGVETLRYYERNGLLPEPSRTSSGYRIYSEDSEARLRFILNAKSVGFSLKDITALLGLRLSEHASAADVHKRTREKMEEIDRKIEHLKSMRRALGTLLSACDGKGSIEACPILASLEGKNA